MSQNKNENIKRVTEARNLSLMNNLNLKITTSKPCKMVSTG